MLELLPPSRPAVGFVAGVIDGGSNGGGVESRRDGSICEDGVIATDLFWLFCNTYRLSCDQAAGTGNGGVEGSGDGAFAVMSLLTLAQLMAVAGAFTDKMAGVSGDIGGSENASGGGGEARRGCGSS